MSCSQVPVWQAKADRMTAVSFGVVHAGNGGGRARGRQRSWRAAGVRRPRHRLGYPRVRRCTCTGIGADGMVLQVAEELGETDRSRRWPLSRAQRKMRSRTWRCRSSQRVQVRAAERCSYISVEVPGRALLPPRVLTGLVQRASRLSLRMAIGMGMACGPSSRQYKYSVKEALSEVSLSSKLACAVSGLDPKSEWADIQPA
ncbi:hypothetical protein B0H16DRAFT_1484693 [Mycena metata]|uniref:Uncharacterized protein n=1 Tax=Mycena metata TaxID=1033252 RepID=A0AAD7DR17_9AGAR|nr:hypothetical protein B0H16DRAFT_1484693 [Mycena metata]